MLAYNFIEREGENQIGFWRYPYGIYLNLNLWQSGRHTGHMRKGKWVRAGIPSIGLPI